MASVSALLLQHLPYKLVLKSSDLHAPVFLKGQTKLEWQWREIFYFITELSNFLGPTWPKRHLS